MREEVGAKDYERSTRGLDGEGAAAPRDGERSLVPREPRRGENACSRDIIEAALRVHSEIGPGALEQVYKVCLAYEVRDRRRHVGLEVPIEVIYRGVKMTVGYRADLIVDGIVLVECKAAVAITPRDEATLLSHLKLSGLRLGLIINFHGLHLRDGIKRMVNRL